MVHMLAEEARHKAQNVESFGKHLLGHCLMQCAIEIERLQKVAKRDVVDVEHRLNESELAIRGLHELVEIYRRANEELRAQIAATGVAGHDDPTGA